ncbi:Uncharacterized protein HZ326_5657 [Fusarium oxysporum f. sp. albedinis]|nr:Uncharacterized protein HZ326_5657 [Fusarium oxysporum f. sp. albedinis]
MPPRRNGNGSGNGNGRIYRSRSPGEGIETSNMKIPVNVNQDKMNTMAKKMKEESQVEKRGTDHGRQSDG